MPLLAALAGHGAMTVLEARPRAIAVVLLLATLGPLGRWAYPPPEDTLRPNGVQKRRLAHMLSLAGPADTVYDGEARFNVFRKDIDYFWFSVHPKRGLETYQTLRAYDYDLLERIERYRPKVISATALPDPEDPRIREHYVPSKRYPDLLVRVEPGDQEKPLQTATRQTRTALVPHLPPRIGLYTGRGWPRLAPSLTYCERTNSTLPLSMRSTTSYTWGLKGWRSFRFSPSSISVRTAYSEAARNRCPTRPWYDKA